MTFWDDVGEGITRMKFVDLLEMWSSWDSVCISTKNVYPRKSRGDKIQGVPSTSKSRWKCPPVHPRIYTRDCVITSVEFRNFLNLVLLQYYCLIAPSGFVKIIISDYATEVSFYYIGQWPHEERTPQVYLWCSFFVRPLAMKWHAWGGTIVPPHPTGECGAYYSHQHVMACFWHVHDNEFRSRASRDERFHYTVVPCVDR